MKKTQQEILEKQLCGCATVRDVIDTAVSMAIDWHEQAEMSREQICNVHWTAAIILGCQVYCETLITLAGKVDGDKGVDYAARLIHDMRAFARAVDDDCHDYIHEQVNREMSTRSLDSLSTVGMTLN